MRPSLALDNLIAEAQALGIKVVRHWEGDKFDLGGAQVDVFSCHKTGPPASNRRTTIPWSCTSATCATSVLLEGDAEKAVECRVASFYHPHADLLKVGHQGSATSTTPEIFASCEADFAVILVGLKTSFALPKLRVLARLQASGVHVYRTDINGA